MKFLLTISLAAALAGTAAPLEQKDPAPPRAAPAEGRWTLRYRYDSVHFSLYTDFSDDAYVSRLHGDLERYFSLFQKEYWDFIRPEHREAHLELAVLGTQDAFDALAAGDARIPSGEKGYSNMSANRLGFLRQDEYYKDIMIVVHELTHVFNRFCLDSTPIWLDEGMAQYYANYAGEESGNANVVGGVQQSALGIVNTAASDTSLVPVSVLLRMKDQEFYGGDSRINYAECWALVYYLRKGIPNGENLLADLYAQLARNQDPVDAFTNVYGDNLKGLHVEWLSFVKSLHGPDKSSPPRQSTNAGKNSK